jgi:hypothetical protein
MSDEENYYLVTADEWKRRKLAEEAQASGKGASIEDRTAGSHRKLGSRFTEIIGVMNERLPEHARLAGSETVWMDQVRQQVNQRKTAMNQNRDTLCDLYEALYFEGYSGTARENINLEAEIRPSIAFILKRDFALKEEHIFRPKQKHQELLRRVYVGSDDEPAIVS